jgi:hypothetical protein
MTEDARRCFDCLEDFKPLAPRFTVEKGQEERRDIYTFETYYVPAREVVCEDCAGWYPDPVPLEVS